MGMDDSSLAIHCVFVETSLGTRLVVHANDNEYVSLFKEKLCQEHSQCFPEKGEITISAVKVERNGQFYHLPDSMNMSKAFDNNSDQDWFVSVDAAVRLDKGKQIVVGGSNLNPDEWLEKSAEITNDPTLEEEAMKRGVDNEKKTRKRKKKSSQKKNTDESLKLTGTVEVEVSSETCTYKKDIESSEKDGVSMGEDKQTCDVEMLGKEDIVN